MVQRCKLGCTSKVSVNIYSVHSPSDFTSTNGVISGLSLYSKLKNAISCGRTERERERERERETGWRPLKIFFFWPVLSLICHGRIFSVCSLSFQFDKLKTSSNPPLHICYSVSMHWFIRIIIVIRVLILLSNCAEDWLLITIPFGGHESFAILFRERWWLDRRCDYSPHHHQETGHRPKQEPEEQI